ncbi:MAG: PDZ domain-containing protein, partial [Planctomycetota bacterium]
MEQREVSGMWGRYVLFIVFSFGILALNIFFNPPKPRKPQAERPDAVEQRMDGAAAAKEGVEPAGPGGREGEPEPGAVEPGEEKTAPEGKEASKPEEPAEEPKADIPPRIAPKPRLITLGSLDPTSPYSGLGTFTNLGAALVRFELSSPNFRDLEHRHGYLGHSVLDEIGHLAPDEMRSRAGVRGCLVDAVGPGTPATACLEQGDRITSLDGREITDFRSLLRALEETRPGGEVELKVARQGKTLTLSATLGRQPMEVIRPEKDDPLSFVCTLSKLGDRKLADLRAEVDQLKEKADELKKKFDAFKKNGYAEVEGAKLAPFNDEISELGKEFARFRNGTVDDGAGFEFTDPKMAHLAIERLAEAIDDLGRVHLELDGLDLRTGAWDIENPEQFDQPGPHTAVTFFRDLPEFGLKISKTFRLEQVAEDEKQNLVLDLKIENRGEEAREVAYQLDGPTGLPTEGSWYASKSGRGWSAVGLRDVVVSWEGQVPSLIG